MYIPLLCLLVVAGLLWSTALRQRRSERPLTWTWLLVGTLMLSALGAVAVPLLIAAILNP